MFQTLTKTPAGIQFHRQYPSGAIRAAAVRSRPSPGAAKQTVVTSTQPSETVTLPGNTATGEPNQPSVTASLVEVGRIPAEGATGPVAEQTPHLTVAAYGELPENYNSYH